MCVQAKFEQGVDLKKYGSLLCKFKVYCNELNEKLVVINLRFNIQVYKGTLYSFSSSGSKGSRQRASISAKRSILLYIADRKFSSLHFPVD